MTELRLRQKVADSKAEISRLRERLATALPPVPNDISPISIVPKWSGAETDSTVKDFLASIEGAAKIARWDGTDCLRIATLLGHFTSRVTSSKQKTRLGKDLNRHFETYLKTRTQISITFSNFKQQNKGKRKDPRNSLTVAKT